MPKGPRANELIYSPRQVAVATAWSTLMAGFCLAAASLSAIKKIEIAVLW
jgi:hypothetical protein